MSDQELQPRRLIDSGEDPSVAALLRQLPEVEPAPSAEPRAWARFEAAGSRRRAPLLLLAAGAATAIALAVVAFRAPPAAPLDAPEAVAALTLVQGSVKGEQGGPLAIGASLPSGANVGTGAGSRAYLRFQTAGALLGPSTQLSLRTTPAGALHLGLSSGEVLVSSSKRAPGAELTVSAGAHRVTVVGTVFRVRAEPFAVEVVEGTVRVNGPDGERLVEHGSAYVTGGAPPASTRDELDLLQWLRAVRKGERALQLSSAGKEARFAGALIGSGPAQVWAPEDAPIEWRTPQPAPAPAPAPAPPEVEPAPAPIAHPAPPPKHRAPATSPPRPDQEEAAEQKLRVAANGDTPRAGIALYQLGLHRLRKTNDLHGAEDAFEEYRRRFASGPLLEDAWLSLIEVHLAAHAYSDALLESNGFLKRFTSSERKNQVRLLRANIEREMGDCTGAIRAYDALAREGGAEADDATFFAAVCEGRNGEAVAAQRRLRAYLAAFPGGRHRDDATRAVEGTP